MINTIIFISAFGFVATLDHFWDLDLLGAAALILLFGAAIKYVEDQLVVAGSRSIVPTVSQIGYFGDGTANTSVQIDGAAATLRDIGFKSGSSDRWTLRVDNAAESGSDAGSDFVIINRDDSGSAIGNALKITRSNGQILVGNGTALAPAIAPAASPTDGIYFSQTGSDQILIDVGVTECARITDAAFTLGVPLNLDTNINFPEMAATPSTPTNGVAANLYMKADKLIVQYNHGGTVRYYYLNLTAGADQSWLHTTSAP
jgi:hypothetical protein